MEVNYKDFLQQQFLASLGQKILLQRKKLKVAAESVALAAAISRITLHRIEKGEPGVGMGAYMSVIIALGLSLSIQEGAPKLIDAKEDNLLSAIAIKDYPQLKLISWQLRDDAVLNAMEAKNMYERNQKYILFNEMTEQEKKLIKRLGVEFNDR
uniref:helix-turn-helix domain-containing protein n=1 Tax=Polynucleobacter sp. TaxID=2029855 RepID=UPI0040477137